MSRQSSTKKSDATARLHQKLNRRLYRLSYPSLRLVVQRVLSCNGFTHFTATNRRNFRGPYQAAGYDLRALVDHPLGCQPVLIQIKAQRTPIGRQCVDSLRGVMLRNGVPQAILVSLSSFSIGARTAAASFPGRPIVLIDGPDLVRLMVALGIGVDGGSEAKAPLQLDEQLFKRLERFTRVKHSLTNRR